MADLPYQPFATQSPSGEGAPGFSMPDVPEASGAGVVRSLGRASQTLEQAGQGQFQQAMKFAEMENETWANEASSSFAGELSDLQNQYRQLEGLNRTNALPGYLARVQNLQDKYAATARSPMAKEHFLTVSRGYSIRAKESMGTLAGEAAEQAHKSADLGAIKTEQSDAVQHYGTADISGAIEGVINKSLIYAHNRGWEKTQADAFVQQNVGQVYQMIAAARIATGDTAGARKVLDDASNQTIPGTDLPIMDAADHLKMLKEVESREEIDERHAGDAERKAETERKLLAEKTMVEAGRVLNENPYALSTNDIWTMPGLDFGDRTRLSNMKLAEEKRRKGETDELEGKHGPGFWNTFSRIHSDGPLRITDPNEIWDMAGPKGSLTLGDAKELVSQLNSKKVSEVKADGYAKSAAAFYLYARQQFAAASVPSKDSYAWLQATLAQEAKLKAEGKSPAQLFNPESPDYLGKDIDAIITRNNATNGINTDNPDKPEETSWWDYVKGFLPQTAPTPQIKTYDDLVHAVRDLKVMTPQQGLQEAIKRGWVNPATGAPKPPPVSAPPVPNAR